MREDNKGVTLIELIIVFIIIGVLAGGTMIGLHSLDSGNAMSSVKRMNAMLDYVRVQNMSKDKSYYLVVEEIDGLFYAKVLKDIGSSRQEILVERLKLKDGNITYYKASGSDPAETPYVIDSDTLPAVNLEVGFLKDSGALRINSDGTYIRRIEVTVAGRTYTICLVKTTGKHYIE